jgi:signal transduction histidine kinase
VIDNARLYQQMEQAVRVRDDFLGIAGHELKTPLTALQLTLQGLARLSSSAESDAGAPSRRLGACLRQVDRLGNLINELLDVSRITAGRLALQPEEVDLPALVREVTGRMGEELGRARCPIELRLPEELLGRWDRARLDQVVVNLLSNACKYGKGQPIEVTLTLVNDGRGARLTVRDEGIGIARADQARIFDRFERAVSERNYGGLGLGLWIVRQIVEGHGGAVRVESAEGKGATFVVELPLSAPG